ncbi:hypothetical protein [Streptomyces spectabilis]|uniref:Uncharacterized protein n=1 Tax=Streptomyces spectabilis TaxID=68270 RepID=A0A5P2X6C7_STRST|nr:hypothetical protein [Streptomyces spectabilis]MBB5108341.1 hypothetical protein [Streptomyces spectabilis]MCI3901098.1 hypothetical protein [Streptomyces spectabilis]QEV58590.1 hypothetical protein CP982_07565 [Streptomyces spectabilis]GGV45952.1 hypothetical protein GCM10010245_72030 [Streptomyces spectabilis]
MADIVIRVGVSAARRIGLEDFVLYRDPVKHLLGQAGAERVCQVECAQFELVELVDIASGDTFRAKREFLRLIPVEFIMRDIDEAPLAADFPELVPAAVAWLQQRSGGQSRPAELPSGGGRR